MPQTKPQTQWYSSFFKVEQFKPAGTQPG